MKEMTKEILKKEIEEILKDLGIKKPKVNFDIPPSFDMGDYTTSVALSYSKEVGSSPVNFAEEIREKLITKKFKHISRIDVVSPGFINFFFDEHYFNSVIKKALKEDFGKNKNLGGEKVIIEYTDPNPFKEFHIGHLMSNAIGESTSRLIEANGAEVMRVNYQGDIGLHIAKAVWAIKKGINLENAYAHGHKAYEEDENSKKEIIEINKKIFDKSDQEINEIYEKSRKESLGHFEEIYKKLGTKFDYYFFESEVASFGKEIVEKNVGVVFEKSDGAIVFKGEKYGSKLHTRVFVNSEGLPTYEAKELGLSKIKYDRFPYDKSIIVTGNEINEYFKVLLVVMKEVFPELAEKTLHLSHGMLRLPTGKMSSRIGDVITSAFLIDQVKEKVLTKMNSRVKMSKTVFDSVEVLEIVAIGAIKYSILRQAIGGDIIFDFEKSISLEGDSGPYLQYSVVRAKSVLNKTKELPLGKVLGDNMSKVPFDSNLPDGWKTTNLEKILERFPDVVERAGKEYAPNYIVGYLTQLAGEFNSFYAKKKIIDENDSSSPYKLSLTQSFANVMEKGLYLLGIKVPEKM